jgi:HNH endonuclease
MLTVERLKELLSYDPESGLFTRLVSVSGNARAGNVAGYLRPDGYIDIQIDGRKYLAHRLAFLYMTGAFPKNEGEHENLLKSDNRWENLRDATHSQNQANAFVRKHNKLGVKCVRLRYGSFQARIQVNGKRKNVGSFETIDEVIAAHTAAAIKHFGEFARTGTAANDNQRDSSLAA